MIEKKVDDLAADLARMRRYLADVRLSVSRLVMGLAAFGIGFGLVLPYARFEAAGADDKTLRLLTVAFDQLSYRGPSRDAPASLFTLGLCSLLLLAVALVAIGLLIRLCVGDVGPRMAAAVKVTAWLGVASAVGAWIVLPSAYKLGTLDDADVSSGPGNVWFSLGMLSLVAVSWLQEWWTTNPATAPRKPRRHA